MDPSVERILNQDDDWDMDFENEIASLLNLYHGRGLGMAQNAKYRRIGLD